MQVKGVGIGDSSNKITYVISNELHLDLNQYVLHPMKAKMLTNKLDPVLII